MQRNDLMIHLAALAIAFIVAGSLTRNPSPTTRPSPSLESTPLCSVPPGLPYQGMAIQIHDIREGMDHYSRMIREVAELGADTVMLSANGYQENISTSDLHIDPDRSPSLDQWQELFAVARQEGLRIVFMPKILLIDTQDGRWRGQIRPAHWNTWFERYHDLILSFAETAEQGRVDVFMVGSELVSTETQTELWRKLIHDVGRVYRGLLGYSANWDHYSGIQFWSDLDLIGLTSYHDLNPAEDPSPTVEELKSAWRPIQKRILDWQAAVGKPILFTEAGWCSQEGCSIEAWNYYRQERCTPAGMEEQKRCYQAFIETWAGHPQVGGIIWWEWTGGPGGSEDYGYTPKGKPAEAVLREWFRRAREPR